MKGLALRFAFSIALPVFLTATLASTARSQGTEIGFEEEFALADDRAAALEQLIPGTEDYYYYQCLHAQHEGRFDEVNRLLKIWVERHGRGGRVEQIENRQALLRYETDPAGTFRFLRDRLGLRFDHQRQVSGEKPGVPTQLEPGLVSYSAFFERASRHDRKTLDGFCDSALESLAAGELSDSRLRSLLDRLKRPDLSNLPALVVRDLSNPRSRGFGSLNIHEALLLEQLEECLRLKPDLLREEAFVFAYLKRLRPNPDVAWRRDVAEREAYLERLQAFAQRLVPAYNSLKAHVLYHQMLHDRELGRPNRDRFLEYLRLPREAVYVNREWLDGRPTSEPLVNFGASFPTELAAIGQDEALVRSYLSHFFASEDSFERYADSVRHEYLKQLFAETKILAGEGDMERWYSMLDDPAYYERLKERVEIEFAPSQRTAYAPDEPVTLEVDLKNVETLLVKVFEINTLNYYLEEGEEVDASINLDGLVANEEETYQYAESPLRLVRRSFEFPALTRPGVFVIELIGNGLSSRAVIRKGRLQLLERSGAAGQVLRVLDERGNHLREASLRLGARVYEADEDGEIVLPFSTEPGTRQVILQGGGRTTLEEFRHLGERFELEAGIFLERESLLAGRTAKILVRPELRLNGEPVSLKLLEEPVLTVSSYDGNGVPSTQEVRELELSEDGELVHEIQVPEGITGLSASLRGRVEPLSETGPLMLSGGTATFQLNGIENTAETACPLLGRTERGYVLDFLGKNGEPRVDEAVLVRLRHGDFTQPFDVTLKTDAQGRIELGALEGIVHLSASGVQGGWILESSARTYPRALQAAAGRTLRVPYQGTAQNLSRSVASLLEMRGGVYYRDRFDRLALSGGYLELRALPPGDYSLWLKEAERDIEVKITAGTAKGGWAVGRDRVLQLEGDVPLQIVEALVVEDELVVRLASVGEDARVHLFGTRYLPAYDAFGHLRGGSGPLPQELRVLPSDSTYHSGREIGDEYRYILERRLATKFPGNMLRRPGLLLNPWALDESDSVIGVGGGAGGKFGGRAGGKRNLRAGGGGSTEQATAGEAGIFPNLEFLPGPSILAANLEPDSEGVVRLSLAELGDGQQLHVLAMDSESTIYTSLVRPEKTLVPAEQRLTSALDPEKHFAEQRRFELLDTGSQATLEDVATADVKVYDTLASVHQLFVTLSGNQDLVEFAFLLRWPTLERAEKLELYSKYACHELHFFLHEKDPTFFAGVVRPYLANKADKTFLDQWLLEGDLSEFLDPWAFARLNTVERILLGRRIAGEGPHVEGHLRELLELLPSDPVALRYRFDVALKSGALDEDTDLGVALESAREQLSSGDDFFLGHGMRESGGGGGGGGAPSRDSSRARPRLAERAGEVEEEPVLAGVELQGALDLREDKKSEKSKDLGRRAKSRSQQLYREASETRAYVEHNYWHTRIEAQNAQLVSENSFWLDYAAADGGEPFFSIHFPEAAGSFAEMVLALAVLDLPFAAAEQSIETEGSRLTLEAGSPLVLVRKELLEATPAAEHTPILISQNFFRLDDRYLHVGNERRDKFVTEEFLIGVAYGCQVVLTNPSSTPRKLELLLQVPAGAIPVQRGFETRGVPAQIGAFGTATFEYHFYFPAAGSFPHYPVHASRGGELIAFAEPLVMNVVAEPSIVDTTSWEHVSQSGTPDEVLAFLAKANLQRLDLARIAWRMKDRSFFDSVIAELSRRHAFDPVLWSYGLSHEDDRIAREYLRHADQFLRRCGQSLDTPLVRIDPIERRAYQHIEYSPLFNSRAHRFGKRQEIMNRDLAGQYLSLLGILAHEPRLDAEAWMSVTYYLLLQDRIEEALVSFGKVNPAGLTTALQYDYFRAYLDFYTDDRALARGIAEPYREHPVARWRAMFQDVLNQLDEAEGQGVAVSDAEDRTQRQTALAASEPQLELEVEAQTVTLAYQNLTSCEVSYYEMDIEFLFSTSPFVQQGSGSFAYIRPNRRDVVALPADGTQHRLELPAEFRSSNVLVEVRGGGVVRREAHYANTLLVQTIESYGQLKVTHAQTGKPLPKVYVKVFAQLSGGGVRFHKDGYTDLRGRFDYVSLSGEGKGGVELYSILVLSEENGAVIREVAPPVK